MIKKGFTLIELLVVVAVLALLASIVFSNLGGAREGARISNALSFQSQTHSLLGSDLVGWWNFNEGDARDISGHENNGTIIGATFTDGVSGTGGSALEFDGVEDYMESLNHFNEMSSLTVSFWILQPESSSLGYHILGNNYNHAISSHGFRFLKRFDSVGNLQFRISDGDRMPIAGTNDLPVEEWTHILGTFDGDRIKLYVNSIMKSYPTTTIQTTGTSVSPFRIGRNEGGERCLPETKIDDVRIYSRALTASEIQTLYAQTKDKYLANE